VNFSDPYLLAVKLAHESEALRTALGANVTIGEPTGSFGFDETGDYADFKANVVGPQGEGTLHCRATRTGHEWKVLALTLQAGAQELSLLPT
jgi:hypothetical protein